MKLQILSTDEILISRIKESGIFQQVTPITSLDVVNADCLLISDSIVDYQELSTIDLKNVDKAFYMLSHDYEVNIEKTVKALCDGRDIVMIPPRLVGEQIINLIQTTLNPLKEKSTNVFSFFSTIGNVGTTTTCLGVAEALSKHTNAKIGVLLLNAWDDGVDQIDYKGSYLNEIKGKLSSQVIQNENEFLSLFHMKEKEKLYILGGNKNSRLERLYTKEEINYLVEKAKDTFEILLIDSGSHFDNALMVQSLVESDLKFLVVNQQTKALKKFNYIFNDILYPLGYKTSDFLLLVNQYHDLMHLPNTKDINKEINVPMLTAINNSEYGLVAEQEQRVLYSYEDPVYQDSINIIAKAISSKAEVEFIQNETKKRKRLFSRG